MVPRASALDLSGLAVAEEDVDKQLAVDPTARLDEIGLTREYCAQFESNLPGEFTSELDALADRLQPSSVDAARHCAARSTKPPPRPRSERTVRGVL